MKKDNGIKKRKIRFEYDGNHKSVGIVFNDKSLTQQQFKDDVNINNIIDKFARGVVPWTNTKRPQYGDFSEVTSYQDALNLVIDTNEKFDSLPAKIRSRFGNDPQQLLEFMNDAANYEEAVKLGIIEPSRSRDSAADKKVVERSETPERGTSAQPEAVERSSSAT